jgi:hypothetical protein
VREHLRFGIGEHREHAGEAARDDDDVGGDLAVAVRARDALPMAPEVSARDALVVVPMVQPAVTAAGDSRSAASVSSRLAGIVALPTGGFPRSPRTVM